MKDVKKALVVMFGDRIMMDLKAGKKVDACRKMMMKDDDIVEKYIDVIDGSIGSLVVVAEKGNKELTELAVKSIRQDIIVIASLAFQHILENDYLTNQTK
jgi:hypothetical protein